MGTPPLPAIFKILCDSKNLAADDVLLSSLDELEAHHKAYAIDTLLKRQQLHALRQLIENYHHLPEVCQARMADHIDLLEAPLRELIRSVTEQTRWNVIDLVARCHSYAMSYLLSMGLRSVSSDTRARSASGLRDLATHLDPPSAETEFGKFIPGQLIQTEAYYEKFSTFEADRKMLATALCDALSAYETHLRTTVIDAVAIMSLCLEDEILTEAQKPRSKFWWAILDMLKYDPKPILATLALQALKSRETRPQIVEVISTCQDRDFMLTMVRQSWLLGDPAIRVGCKSIRRLAWLESSQKPLFEITAEELRQTVRFLRATNIPDTQKVQWYRSILLSDRKDKQVAALFGIVEIDNDISCEVLRVAIDWAEPELAGIALRVLIARNADDAPSLPARYRAKPDLSGGDSIERPITGADFSQYWSNYERMSEPYRLTVGRRLLATDPGFVQSLADRLKSSDAAERAQAVNIIKGLQLTDRFRERMLECALDPDRFVRSAAVKALSQLGSAVSERLLSNALEDEDRRVRANAIEALDDLRSSDRAEKIGPSLTDSDHRVRAVAIRSLLELRVRDAAESLLQMLRDPSRAHRISALWVVEKHGLAGIMNQVSSMAEHDADEVVRKRARRLLRAEKRKQRRREVPIPPPREGHQV